MIAYSSPTGRDRRGRDFDVRGRLSLAHLEEVPVDADFYVCRPASFMDGIAAAMAARGVAPDRVRTEAFGPRGAYLPGLFGHTARPPHPPAGLPASGPEVSFSRSNLSVRWAPAFGSLLDLAEACDVPAGFGCRMGVCHLCQSGLVSGEVDYQTEPLEPPPAGQILLCCSQPRGDVALDL